RGAGNRFCVTSTAAVAGLPSPREEHAPTRRAVRRPQASNPHETYEQWSDVDVDVDVDAYGTTRARLGADSAWVRSQNDAPVVGSWTLTSSAGSRPRPRRLGG